MAHLLMIESWVGGTGRLLPVAMKRLGHQYTFVTRNRHHYLDSSSREIHPVLEHADNVFTFETNDIPALIDFLGKQHEILNFDGVLTVCDYYIETVVEVAQALGLAVAFSSNVAQERDKYRMRAALQQAGIPNPVFRTASSWEDVRRAAMDIGYPLVLKPVDLASSAFVRLVQNETELYDAFQALEEFPLNFRQQPRQKLCLLEEYMSGPEVSVEACTVQNDTTILGITDKTLSGTPYFIEDGHMFPAALDPTVTESVHDLVLQALRAVGHDHGITHTEVKLTPEGPRIVEINPRPAGNNIIELIHHVVGIDLLLATIDLALNQRPALIPQNTGIASAAIKFIVPAQSGYVTCIHGTDMLDNNPHVARWIMNARVGTQIAPPVDNACYLGHVITVDRHGREARRHAEQAISQIDITIDDTPEAEVKKDSQ